MKINFKIVGGVVPFAEGEWGYDNFKILFSFFKFRTELSQVLWPLLLQDQKVLFGRS